LRPFVRVVLLLVVGDIGTVVAGAGGGQLEGLDGEGEVLVISVIYHESVVDVLLDTLGFVAFRDKRTGVPGCGAFFDPGGLSELLVVSLHVVDDDPPLSVGVDSAKGLDVGGHGGTQVGLLHDLLQPVHAVVGVGDDVLVDGLDTVVVVRKSVLNLVCGVIGVFKAPSLRVVLGTGRWGIVVLFRGVMHWGGVVGGGMVNRGVVWGYGMVDKWGGVSIGRLSMVDRLGVVGWFRVVDRGIVVGRFGAVAICWWGGGVAIGGV